MPVKQISRVELVLSIGGRRFCRNLTVQLVGFIHALWSISCFCKQAVEGGSLVSVCVVFVTGGWRNVAGQCAG